MNKDGNMSLFVTILGMFLSLIMVAVGVCIGVYNYGVDDFGTPFKRQPWRYSWISYLLLLFGMVFYILLGVGFL
jgi:hypothetical protein